jgi:hypothetical protein
MAGDTEFVIDERRDRFRFGSGGDTGDETG